MYDNFEDVKVGDKVKCSRGTSMDRICRVYHVTAKTFDVEGFGRFWKRNGKGHGDADSWHGRYANHIEEGDVERLAAESRKVRNRNLFHKHSVRDFNDDELARVAGIIKECNTRRNLKAATEVAE